MKSGEKNGNKRSTHVNRLMIVSSSSQYILAIISAAPQAFKFAARDCTWSISSGWFSFPHTSQLHNFCVDFLSFLYSTWFKSTFLLHSFLLLLPSHLLLLYLFPVRFINRTSDIADSPQKFLIKIAEIFVNA